MYNIRSIVIDEEMTSLDLAGGARLVEIGAAVTGLSDEFLAQQPRFADIAQSLKDFIGDSRIVIYCAIKKNSSADQLFLNNEMALAGHEPFPPSQWLNLRHWATRVFKREKPSLNDLLDNYSITRTGRDDNKGHGGMADARLTAELYPRLRADWKKVTRVKSTPRPKSQKTMTV